MRIELKQNRIAIILTEAETNYLASKATAAGQEDLNNYIKTKLLKALELKGFEDSAIVNLANNFNLEKIKHVSTELSQRQTKPTNYLSPDSEKPLADGEELISEEELMDNLIKKDVLEEEIADDLLSELLDKDLLEGRLSDKVKSDQADRDGAAKRDVGTRPDVGARFTEPLSERANTDRAKKRPSSDSQSPKTSKQGKNPEPKDS